MDMYRIAAVLSILWTQIAGDCRLPASWHGRWFQSGLGEVNIHSTAIDRKGVCHQTQREWVLLQNSDWNCFQCLLVMQRHRNIIQYKESYCISTDSLSEVCSQIRVEAILYTLVREPALPENCPFQHAFHFKYNNNTGGWCTSPTSYVHSCASSSKVRFQFQHCPEAAYTHYRDVELECVASWKDGSEKYMYGGFTAPDLANKEDSYRCFMYTVFGTVVLLAMSADATCRGLRAPTDGPLIMEFTKDVFGWPQPSCRFPSWLMDEPWQDLAARHSYEADELGETLLISYRHGSTLRPHVKSALRCIRPDLENSTDTQFVAVSYTSNDCENRLQCIKFVLQRPDVIEVYRGAFIQSLEERCQVAHFEHYRPTLAIPRHHPPQTCPLYGRYTQVPDASGCHLVLESGCNMTSRIILRSSCAHKPLAELECLLTWQTPSRQYLLARSVHDNQDVINCFSIKAFGGTLELLTDTKCNQGAPYLMGTPLAYTFEDDPGKCEEPSPVVVPANQNQVSPADQPDVAAGYKHAAPDDVYYDEKPQATFFNSGCQLRPHMPVAFLLHIIIAYVCHR